MVVGLAELPAVLGVIVGRAPPRTSATFPANVSRIVPSGDSFGARGRQDRRGRRGGLREPRHLGRRLQPLPGAGRDRDARGARDGPVGAGGHDDRLGGGPQRPAGGARTRDDARGRAVERDRDRRAVVDREPVRGDRDGRRRHDEVLVARLAQRPRDRARPPDDRVDADALAGREADLRRQLPVADVERHGLAARRRRVDGRECAAEGLDVQPRERDRVAAQRHAGVREDGPRERAEAEQGHEREPALAGAREPLPSRWWCRPCRHGTTR